MNILFILQSNEVGGIQTATNNIIEKLKFNYNIKIVYIDGERKGLKENEYILKPNIRFKNFIIRKISLLYKIIDLYFYKKENKIDIVVSNGSFCSFFEGILKIFQKNIAIATIHSIQSKEAKRKSSYSKICNFSNKYLLRYFNEIISVSNGIEKDLLLTYPKLKEKKHSVIYNGFDFNKIKEKSKERIEYEEKEYFLFVGRLDEVKQVEIILKIFYHYSKLNSNYKLLLVGSGNESYTTKLKNMVKKFELENRVTFLGKQDNPYKYMRKAVALLLTSRYEGLPSVLIETLALGVPVISTNSSSGVFEILCDEFIVEDMKIEKNKLFKSGIIVPYIEYDNKELELRSEEKYFLEAMNTIERDKKLFNIVEEECIKKFDIKNTTIKMVEIIKQYEKNKKNKFISN